MGNFFFKFIYKSIALIQIVYFQTLKCANFNCGKESFYYCCWNTSYCDEECQRMHWIHHMKTCSRISNLNINNKSHNENDLNDTDVNPDQYDYEYDTIGSFIETNYLNDTNLILKSNNTSISNKNKSPTKITKKKQQQPQKNHLPSPPSSSHPSQFETKKEQQNNNILEESHSSFNGGGSGGESLSVSDDQQRQQQRLMLSKKVNNNKKNKKILAVNKQFSKILGFEIFNSSPSSPPGPLATTITTTSLSNSAILNHQT